MNEQTENDQQPAGTPAEEKPPTSGEPMPMPEGETSGGQSSAAKPPEKFKFNIGQFVTGFLGWFLLTFPVFALKMDATSLMLCGGVMFLVNVAVLIFLLVRYRSAGLGMLAALGVNLVVSLILGLANNALCFIPFYKRP